MKLIGIRTPKPRQYAYKPVFFDPEKEEKEKRRKQLEESDEGYVPGSELRDKMKLKRSRMDDSLKRKSRRSSILITILLAAILLYIIFIR